jgi:two-component system sensor histidine kinase KdpD
MAGTYLEHPENLSEEEKNRMVSSISEDANWLLNMVENLLSVTRIHVEDTHVNTMPEPVEEVVSEAVVRLRKRLPQIQIHVRVPEEFLMIPMDATLIEQVIINLCENAYYHSGVDTPIDFFIEKEEDEVAFHIRDYGRGIAPDRIDAIFDGAGTDPNESGDSHKGMGIGLTICKTIINAHHGRIYAENHSKGVEFVFTLPMGKETEENE